jgi:succinate dehydrogenase / fumarate reductase iron-sulfur subunit
LKPYPAIEGGEPFNSKEEILIEPIPHLPVLKDLVVDMTTFFEYYRAVEPVLKPKDDPPERERQMDRVAVVELEHYTNCILCASCFGACPVDAKNPDYLGPAALAKLYRFHIDPREAQDGSRLERANVPNGWPACEFHANCRTVCPRGVPPNIAIGKARAELGKQRKELKDR